MTRPRLPVIVTHEARFVLTEVSQAQDNFLVTYQGKPIKVSRTNTGSTRLRTVATTFATPAAAFNCRDKLNKLFKTDQFAVMVPYEYQLVHMTEKQITRRTY